MRGVGPAPWLPTTSKLLKNKVLNERDIQRQGCHMSQNLLDYRRSTFSTLQIFKSSVLGRVKTH